ncbi:DUF2239 family protein [Mesorhizobium sp. SP-1A]|uniref:DUF2239 family protein n=1 Tax=Mesorhizobium sp. SP-1A TaxID=3077840 RepID=UPI0028F6F4E5|nr:DUF2239 family protein [Mesorhizobium sp. SP-1A]
MTAAPSCTAFAGPRRIASGPLAQVALAVKAATEAGAAEPILVFDDATGRVVDLDLRGSAAEIAARLAPAAAPEDEPLEATRGRGRPKLGVVAREITLLPRHWDWLSAQPGGASVALRKLVDDARRTAGAADRQRAAHESAYRFMTTMAGDLPGYEEATRALFAGDRARFGELSAAWPRDIGVHADRLAFATADSG